MNVGRRSVEQTPRVLLMSQKKSDSADVGWEEPSMACCLIVVVQTGTRTGTRLK